MKKLLTIISGIIVGLFPVIIAGILSLFIYLGFPGIVGVVVSALLVLASGVAGIAIFKKIQLVGLIDFFTIVHASPDLDELDPADRAPSPKKKRR